MTLSYTEHFDYLCVNRVIAGEGKRETIASCCGDLGLSDSASLIVVTDPGIVSLQLHCKVTAALEASGYRVLLFSDVEADPSEKVVMNAVNAARQANVSGVIGLGGGSSMDVAKMVALLASPTSCDVLPDAYGVNNAKGPRLPLIQIPTTAGTGSEVTTVAIITTGETTKNACVSAHLLADIVVLDPQLTCTIPSHIAAATGIDAMVHAIEAYTSAIKKNPMSDFAARQAMQLLSGNIKAVCSGEHSAEQRLQMLTGAMLAGQAFANAPVGAVHALAYPLGGHFHVSHGNSNALVLVEVMRFNLPNAQSEYAQLADVIALTSDGQTDADKALTLIAYLDDLMNALNVPRQLSDYGITESDIDLLASDAMKQTRLLQNNPREINKAQVEAIYCAIL